MKSIFSVFTLIIISYSFSFGQNANCTIEDEIENFKNYAYGNIVGATAEYYALDVSSKLNLIQSKKIQFMEELFDEAEANGLKVDRETGYIQENALFADEKKNNKCPDREKIFTVFLTESDNKLITKDGYEITITWGTSSSDNESSYKKVNPLLLKAVKQTLNTANNLLKKNDKPLINSIAVSCTTNGKHSECSYHYDGLAIDIYQINGQNVIDSTVSFVLQDTFTTYSNSFNKSEYYIFEWVKTMQIAFEEVSFRRENLGPVLQRKWNPISQNSRCVKIAKHKGHMHFAVKDWF